MKIHDPNSRFVFVPDLRKGDVVEPGFFHQEQVTISQRPEMVADTKSLYAVVSTLDNGQGKLDFAAAGDGVWVFPPRVS
jgi:hypothetical protein